MRSNDVLGFIFAGTLDDKIPELAASRTTASIPIGGKYRVIDFVLSNMSNAGINNVGIIAKSNFLSLTDHVGSGSAYDLSKRRSSLTLLTPYGGKSFSSYVETLYNMHGYLDNCREEYVMISPGNVITNFDYTDLFDFHSKKNADISLVYKTGVVPSGYERPITVDVSEDGKVEQLFVKPSATDETVNQVFGSILVKKAMLMEEVRKALSVNQLDFKRLLHTGGVDIIQPDLSHAGGVTEVKKIASMAEAYDVALAPHCPLGPIALAACLTVDATSYNACIQEQSIGIHYNVGKSVLDYVRNGEDFRFVDGRVQLPVKPGLGVEVNRELVLEENKTPHQWKNPVWRHEDGSIAEW